MSFILLLVGFIFLIKGADYFVEGSSNIAKKFKISPMIIGLTIVAMGTSMPELSVSITSSLIGKNDMSLANVVGSNMFNILMALGISSLIINLPINKDSIKFDIPFLIGIGILLLLMLFDLKLSIFEGLILGFLGSIIPVFITMYGYSALYDKFDGRLFSDFLKLIEPTPFIYTVSLVLIAIGMIVGMFGSSKAVRKYLKI